MSFRKVPYFSYVNPLPHFSFDGLRERGVAVIDGGGGSESAREEPFVSFKMFAFTFEFGRLANFVSFVYYGFVSLFTFVDRPAFCLFFSSLGRSARPLRSNFFFPKSQVTNCKRENRVTRVYEALESMLKEEKNHSQPDRPTLPSRHRPPLRHLCI